VNRSISAQLSRLDAYTEIEARAALLLRTNNVQKSSSESSELDSSMLRTTCHAAEALRMRTASHSHEVTAAGGILTV